MPYLKIGRTFIGIRRVLRNAHYRVPSLLESYQKHPKVWSNKIAYLAGIVDGEGYLKLEKHGTFRLVIGMCSKKTIYWIKKNFDGNVTIQPTAAKRLFYVWRLNGGKDLVYLLLLMIPFLINKRLKAVKALTNLVAKFKTLDHTWSGNLERM